MARWSDSAWILIVLLCAACFVGGCASMFGGGSNQALTISSDPSGAHFVIKSSSGLQMADGVTPQTLRLPRKNEYQIEVTLDGYKPRTLALTRGTNGWIWANLFLGGIFGLIIDFSTGAGYKLEPAIVSVTLETALLEDGSTGTFAVARLLSSAGRVLREERALLEPVDMLGDSLAGSLRQ
jgi:hypothetical protein